jgi:hypothetical protein
MADVFTISEKFVKERDGANYALEKYKEGTDFVRRRNRFGFKVVFRKGFLGEAADVVDPSLVEHKQQKEEERAETGSQTVVPVKMPECGSAPMVAKIVRKYPNPRFVDTDVCGRVFCGEKGRGLKTGQLILVLDGTIVLGKAGMIATATTVA